MRWEDEKYVRVFTRDTADWLALSFDAQGLFTLLLRKVDRAGILPLGRHGKKAVAVVLGHTSLWAERLAPALDELLADGCVTIDGDRLIVPNFVAAQEATMSGALRTREWRERSKDRDGYQPGRGLVPRDETSPPEVTERHENVTPGDATRRAVTPRDSFLPSVPSEPTTSSAAPCASAEEPPPPVPLALVASEPTPAPKPKKPPKPDTDPRFAPLRVVWEAEYREVYGETPRWSVAESAGVHRVIAVDPEAFRARVRRGLRAQGFDRCATVAEVTSDAKWNRLAGTGPPQGNGKVRVIAPVGEFKEGDVF